MVVAVDVKRSGKKLPDDVAAIILRNLEKKAANPEAFKPKTSHAYEKDPGYTTCQPFRSMTIVLLRHHHLDVCLSRSKSTSYIAYCPQVLVCFALLRLCAFRGLLLL